MLSDLRLVTRARIGIPLAMTILVARYLVQMARSK